MQCNNLIYWNSHIRQSRSKTSIADKFEPTNVMLPTTVYVKTLFFAKNFFTHANKLVLRKPIAFTLKLE